MTLRFLYTGLMKREGLGYFCASGTRTQNRFIAIVIALALCVLVVPTSTHAAERTVRESAATSTVHVSWYGHRFQGKLMANGKPFNMYAFTAASKTLPFGTRVVLRNPHNDKSVTVTIADRGPFVRGRDFDVSWAAARKLGILGKGVSSLEVVLE